MSKGVRHPPIRAINDEAMLQPGLSRVEPSLLCSPRPMHSCGLSS
jgi:hypothetical protein